jgi:pSer/pThr/pTyr-binding forkhead associated (FHA) protein
MAAAWKLIIADDAGKQIVVPFARDIITIGRKDGNTIRLTERNVSRNHAKLSKDNGQILIEDLGSFNGVLLNGDRIEGRVPVHEGDTIQIGDYQLAIHAQSVAGDAAQPADPGTSMPGARSTATHLMTPDDTDDTDDFAGDTQRWSAPAALQTVAPRTQNDAAVGAGPTAEATARANPDTGGFGADNGDTARVTFNMLASIDHIGLDSMKAGAPSTLVGSSGGRVSDELDPDATTRQPVSPAAISMPPQRPAPQGETPPEGERAAPTRPERVSPPRPLPQVPYPGEQTESLRPSPGAADVTLPRLVVLNTIFAGSTFPLYGAEAIIGRTDDNDITIEHKSISRNHAKIVREGDRVRILDLRSANGVLVNDEEVEAAVLRTGDVVELGRVRMRFVPIGEHFAVPADEIERARIADRNGGDFETDSSTGITNPVRSKRKDPSSGSDGNDTLSAMPKRARNALFVALGLIIGLLIIVAVLVMRSSSPAAPTSPVAAVPVAPPPAPPPAVAAPPKAPPAEDVDAIPPARTDDAPRSSPASRASRDKKKIDVDKHLKDAAAAWVIGRSDEAVRLSRDVLEAVSATGKQKERARKQLELACAKPGTKGCR